MLCEIGLWGNFWTTWAALSVIAFVIIMIMSSSVFYFYYQHPTYQRWTHKSNPAFPSTNMVKREIIQMMKGMCSATLCPALSLYLAQHKMSNAYCGWSPSSSLSLAADSEFFEEHSFTHRLFGFVGVQPFGLVYHVMIFFVMWVCVDFWEFFYHRLGHTTHLGWAQHKHHHFFYNPSPFAVIADEYIDQFVRAFPLLLFPLLGPVNMDVLFFQFGLLFYAYGVYLHWGYEFSWLDAHHPFINSSFQHYLHHAISGSNKPYHTGFFTKFWDRLFGSVYTEKCFCAKCEYAAGKRSKTEWQRIIQHKPDYSVLWSPSFWLQSETEPEKQKKK